MVTERRLLACAAVLLIGISPAHGQTRADCERQYTPQRAQEGKDVIWEPIEDSMVGRMLELARVTAADKVYDLGSGDGLRATRAALRPRGVLAVWSASPDRAFSKRLQHAGFEVNEHVVRPHRAGKGPRHTIWIAAES